MAQNIEVKCINKTDRTDPHERIRNIGGVNPDGGRWKMSVPDAILAMEQKKYIFYVSAEEKTVWVVIAVHNGRKYLRTEPDGIQPNNLLALPECP